MQTLPLPYLYIFCRTAGYGIQVQGEEEVSLELIEERERAIRQLEVCEKENRLPLYSTGFTVGCRSELCIFFIKYASKV